MSDDELSVYILMWVLIIHVYKTYFFQHNSFSVTNVRIKLSKNFTRLVEVRYSDANDHLNGMMWINYMKSSAAVTFRQIMEKKTPTVLKNA